ncbi:MAG: hypothetical protein RIA63_00550 [Cyclobacteriaceae bacterium]
MLRFLILLFSVGHTALHAQNTQVAFTIKEKDLIPEGITYDPITQNFFVGSIHKKKVVGIDHKGKVTDYISSGQDGIGEVLGMHVDAKRRHLWICSNEGENLPGGKSMVHQYNLESGNLIKKYEWAVAEEIHLFNDLVVTESGEVFVTDSDFSSIFRIDPSTETIAPLIKSDNLRYCNGIATTPNKDKIVVSTARGLTIVDILTKEIARIDLQGYLSIADGLYHYENSLIAIQNIFFPVAIVQFNLNPSFNALESANALVADHPNFDIPTTGVVVGNWFYFVANSQLLARAEGQIKSPKDLKDVTIMKVRLQ